MNVAVKLLLTINLIERIIIMEQLMQIIILIFVALLGVWGMYSSLNAPIEIVMHGKMWLYATTFALSMFAFVFSFALILTNVIYTTDDRVGRQNSKPSGSSGSYDPTLDMASSQASLTATVVATQVSVDTTTHISTGV